ncbi:MAG TPA: DUF559 domain-containing protein [Mycobacteriales bacterium]|nr:DUF559 domain-containing protein [Mycobacteriales bacterium]
MNPEEVGRTTDNVVSISDLRAAGMRLRTIERRVKTGRWQRVLPGVVVLHSGPLTRQQWRRSALAYGGPTAVLSHYTAALLHGLRVTRREQVEATIAHGLTRRSTDAVRFHQSRTLARRVVRHGLPCTTVARTVIDVGCSMKARDDVRALVSDSVQRGLTSVRALLEAADRAPRHGRGLLTATLEEIAAGARSAGEARLLALVRQAGLPTPILNARLQIGRRLVIADAYWSRYRLIVEIDGATWHLNAVAWDNDLTRQNALQAAGFAVLRFPYSRLIRDPEGVIQDIRRALDELPAA